jgi:hypothetical protein
MTRLIALDLEYNCFDILDSLKDDMKYNIRPSLTEISLPWMDFKRPLLNCDMYPSAGMILLRFMTGLFPSL